MFDIINHRRRHPLTLQDVGNCTKQPVKPVEDGTIFALWLAAEQSNKRLQKQKPQTANFSLCPSHLTRFFHYYPRDAMLARIFATATCLSVRLSVWTSVCHMPVLYLAE